MIWYTYILECADQSLYTGITNDLFRRLDQHNNGTGAKYTRGRGPVVIKFCWQNPSKSKAAIYESQIKKKTKEDKLKLIDYWSKNRFKLSDIIKILKDAGWVTENKQPQASNNKSVYSEWYKTVGNKKAILYLGNYFLEYETSIGKKNIDGGCFGWADKFVEQQELNDFINSIFE